MKDKVIKLKTAKLAKEKGFSWKVEYYYDSYVGDIEGKTLSLIDDRDSFGGREFDNYNRNKTYPTCSAPTQSLLQKWLREKHNKFIIIIGNVKKGDSRFFTYSLTGIQIQDFKWDLYESYERALEAGLLCALNEIEL